MRARDVRAIAFCVTAAILTFVVSYVLLQNTLVSLALTAALGAWLATRPRMQRVFHRLRGDPDWSGYFKND
jgi:uncharacterized membrane protein YfcA